VPLALPAAFPCPLPAGLYLPTSDVDAVIMGSGCTDILQGLKALANALARKNMAKNMQVGGRVGGWWLVAGAAVVVVMDAGRQWRILHGPAAD
jgi:hypothetical protein